jgi:hypothetical protein
VPNSKFDAAITEAVQRLTNTSARPAGTTGIALTPLDRTFEDGAIRYSSLDVDIDRNARRATLTIRGPAAAPPATTGDMQAQGANFWPLRLARELDDAILHLRANEPEIGTLVFKSSGDAAKVVAYDTFLDANASHWLTGEILHYWKRVLKPIDLTSRSLVAMIEPGSCFAGTLAEIVFACPFAAITPTWRAWFGPRRRSVRSTRALLCDWTNCASIIVQCGSVEQSSTRITSNSCGRRDWRAILRRQSESKGSAMS